MRRHRQILASLMLLLILAPALHAEVLNRVVLRVNDRIATLYDYQQRRADMVREVLRREQDPEERQRLISQAGEAVFADMFRELLLESRADQLLRSLVQAARSRYNVKVYERNLPFGYAGSYSDEIHAKKTR